MMDLAFEIADAIANDGGYADDPSEANRRAAERDRLVPIISATLKAELGTQVGDRQMTRITVESHSCHAFSSSAKLRAAPTAA